MDSDSWEGSIAHRMQIARGVENELRFIELELLEWRAEGNPDESILSDPIMYGRISDRFLFSWRFMLGSASYIDRKLFDEIPTLPNELRSSTLWKDIDAEMPQLPQQLAAIIEKTIHTFEDYARYEHGSISRGICWPYLEAACGIPPCNATVELISSTPMDKTWHTIQVDDEKTNRLPSLLQRSVDIVIELPSWAEWDDFTDLGAERVELSPYCQYTRFGSYYKGFVIMGVVCKSWADQDMGWRQLETFAFCYANRISWFLSQCDLEAEESYTIPLMLFRGDNYFLYHAHVVFERTGAIKSVKLSGLDPSVATLRSEYGHKELVVVLGRIIKWAHKCLRPWWNRILKRHYERAGLLPRTPFTDRASGRGGSSEAKSEPEVEADVRRLQLVYLHSQSHKKHVSKPLRDRLEHLVTNTYPIPANLTPPPEWLSDDPLRKREIQLVRDFLMTLNTSP